MDVERARTVKGWLPRRLGGGLGGTRRGGPEVNIRHSGREEGRDRDRGGGGGRDVERRRSRSRDRDRERRRRRSRSRSKERTKKRSRSRERKRRSRSREGRKKRSRSRDRTKRSRRSRSRELKQERGEDGSWGGRVKVKDEPDDGMGYEGYPQDDNERYNIKQERTDDEDRKPFNANGGYDDDGY